MRPPRIRLTIGTILFAVALVAIDCGIYRLLGTLPAEHKPGGPLWQLPRHFVVGFVPLLNIALIGGWWAVWRRTSSARRAATAEPSAPFPWVTFLNVHLLVLGYLVFNFLVDGIESALNNATTYSLDWVYGQPRQFVGHSPSSPLREVLIVLAVSVPLLTFSWVGGILTRRFVARWSRSRQFAVAVLISLGFGAAILAACSIRRPFLEKRPVTLGFEVVAEGTRRPIRGAWVRLAHPFERTLPLSEGQSGTDGRSRVTSQFDIKSERNAFGSVDTFSTWGRWLEVAAPGYQPVVLPLLQAIGPVVGLDHPRSYRVELTEGQPPAGPLADLAGRYQLTVGDYYGSCIEFKPDGRFAWADWSHMSSGSMEFGFVHRAGATIRLEALPKPDTPTHEGMGYLYHVVDWDGGRYLCAEGQVGLRELLHLALAPSRSWVHQHAYRVYRFAANPEQDPTGLPRFSPEAWAQLGANELLGVAEPGSLGREWLDQIVAEIDASLGGETLRFVRDAILPDPPPEEEPDIP